MPIPIFTTSQGHFSIAEATKAFLDSEKIESDIKFFSEKGLPLYSFAYKNLPNLYGSVYQLSKQKLANMGLRKLLLLEHEPAISKIIEDETPSHVLNTSFGFSEALEKVKKIHPFTFINIVPNPRTFWNQDVEIDAEVLCVFDEQTKKDAEKLNKNAQIVETGWFVRPEFEQQYDKKKIRAALLLQDTLTLLFVTGSEGTHGAFEAIKSLTRIPNIQIIIACGKNHSLLAQCELLAKTSISKIIPLSFTKEIHKYMKAADLVIGKAGPNMLFESIATHTPFFAITHVAGLEDGNLQIIREYSIGIVEEDLLHAEEKLLDLISNPDSISNFLPNVKKLAEQNKHKRLNLLPYL